jgi:uncharacterized membrane protein
MEALFLAILVVAYVLVSPAVVLVRQRRMAARLTELSEALRAARAEIDGLRRAAGYPTADAAMPEPGLTAAPAPRVTRPDLAGRPAAVLEPIPGPEPDVPGLPAPAPTAPEAQPDLAARIGAKEAEPTDGAPATGPVSPATPRRNVEERLTSQWLIWVGAVAVALSAVFLFRYAIEQGWLTEATRVGLGLALGGLLVAAGDWTRRHPVGAVRRGVRPDHVPPALTGSGLFAAFVSIWAAHGLFGLIPAPVAFVTLGAVAFGGLALSLRQGPFVALIGLLAGYLVPALVVAPDGDALPLFLYLFVLSAACLLLLVWRRWWWFAYLTLVGALTWPVLWLSGPWTEADQGVLSAYGLGLAVLFAVLSTRLPLRQPEQPVWHWLTGMLADTSGLGFSLSGVLLLLVAAASGFNGPAFLVIGLYGAAALALAVRRGALESLLPAAALVALASVVLWPVPLLVSDAARVQDLPLPGFGPFLVPPEYRVFAFAIWGFTALFGLGGFLGVFRARTPSVWAALSVLMPLLLFLVGYDRIGGLETDIAWALVAAGLALLAGFAATQAARQADLPQREVVIAFFAAGATAVLALAFTCVMREAWLTVAIAAEIAALAWIWDRTGVRALRAVAATVTLGVIVRLVLNPQILAYQGGIAGTFGWVVYGYGLPAVATLLAARIFARGGRDAVTVLCEIAGTGFAFLMVALQLKLWTSGTLTLPDWSLQEQAIQTVWWLAAAGLLLHEAAKGRRGWTYPAGLGLLGLSGLALLVGHLLALMPLLTDEPVGTAPVANLLALAYLAPALGLAVIGHSTAFRLPDPVRPVLKGAAGVLAFVWLSLEVRRAFWGTTLGLDDATRPVDLELYAYSAVWIVFALSLLALGVLRQSVPLRYASLAVLLVTVVKVFAVDMAGLTGLFRVASFLGLGLTLIGIARVYQRFVFRPTRRSGEGQETVRD